MVNPYENFKNNQRPQVEIRNTIIEIEKHIKTLRDDLNLSMNQCSKFNLYLEGKERELGTSQNDLELLRMKENIEKTKNIVNQLNDSISNSILYISAFEDQIEQFKLLENKFRQL